MDTFDNELIWDFESSSANDDTTEIIEISDDDEDDEKNEDDGDNDDNEVHEEDAVEIVNPTIPYECRICLISLHNKLSYIAIPCGHGILCDICQFIHNICPICGNLVTYYQIISIM